MKKIITGGKFLLSGIKMLRKLLLILLAMISLAACTEKDQNTKEEVPVLEAEANHIVFHYGLDSMVRKDLEYFDRELVIEPVFYEGNGIERGDVVFFSTPDHEIYESFDAPSSAEYDISRVIALEGEKIRIKEGQIYINDRRLDTFYGKLLIYGYEMNDYFLIKAPDGSPVCDPECRATVEEYLKRNMDEIEIPEGHVFVLSDNSVRDIGSLIWGPLSIENIEGKVLGYKEGQ